MNEETVAQPSKKQTPHAPFPWAMVYGDDGHHLIFAADGPIARIAVRADADEQQANADLLLSAPLLLAALRTVAKAFEQAIRSNLSRDVYDSDDEYTQAVRSNVALVDALAAIAKAEGR